jgi:O-acetyl-ADP-ribose deacetylase (regulator of RNase III)
VVIELASGDMWAVPAAVRVNAVNCVGVMGKGVARAFRDRYPAMFRAYTEACAAGELRPGVLHVWRAPTGETVANLPTKTDWRRPSEYAYVEAGLRALRRELGRAAADGVVTLPALGCGNGALDWARVLPMIEAHLGDLPQRVLVFPPAGATAPAGLSRRRFRAASHAPARPGPAQKR